MEYRLRWDAEVHRRLKELSEGLRREIVEVLLDLRSDPYPPTSAPLRRELSRWRKIRVNGWRIIYRVDDEDRLVFVRDVRPRNPNTYLNV